MRLFIGIELDDAVRSGAAAVADALRTRLGARVDARWVPAANLHITLWFIGEADTERAAAILRAIDAPFDVAAFELRIAGAGAFPSSGAPRVFWLGVRSGGQALAAIHQDLAGRLRPLGIEPERQQYSAHLTIGRVKGLRRAGRDIRAALDGFPAEAGSCRVERVTAFRSWLSPKGPTYEPLLRVPLR